MLTGKQRKFLKGMAHDMEPILNVGKNGVTENLVAQIDQMLETRELIKVKVLNNSFLEAKEVANEIAEKTGAEFVQAIGNKFVIYRESEENKEIKLPRK